MTSKIMLEIFAILGVVLTLYARTFKFKLVVDDLPRYQDIQSRNNVWHAGLKKTNPLKFYFENIKGRLYGAGIFGIDPKKDHMATTATHALICVLIYLALGHNQISLCAALLYAVNPINHQTSIWLNGRRYAINIILVLVMLMLPKPFGLLPWMLTPIFQISAIFAPVLLGFKYFLIFPVALVIGFSEWNKKYRIRMATINNDDQRKFTAKRLIVTIKMFGFYAYRMIVPGRVFMIYPHLHDWGMTKRGNEDAYAINREFYLGVLALITTLIGIIFLEGAERLYLAFALVSVLQWCAIFPIVQHSTDRYASLPNVFVMYLVSFLALTFLGAYALPLLALLGGYYIAELRIALPMYENIQDFHHYHNYHQPKNVPSRYIMANGNLANHKPLEAWYHTVEGLKHNPKDFKLNIVAAQINMVMGDKETSQKFLEIAKANIYIGHEEVWKETIDKIEASYNMPMVYAPKTSTPLYVPNRAERRAQRNGKHSSEVQLVS